MNQLRALRIVGLVCLSLVFATAARANEIWVAPTLQTDTGGLGVGNGIWPVTAQGVTRLVLAVPNDLQAFQGAKLILIPGASVGAGVLHVYVCSAQNSNMVGASCSAAFDVAFTGSANRLVEVDVSAALASRITDPGAQYVAMAAYTTPTMTSDHIMGMRFAYEGTPGPQGPQGIQGPVGPQGLLGPQGPQGVPGAVGPRGPEGLLGPAGPQGTQGEIGPQGIPGPAGVIGATGPQGPIGPQGTQGPTGPMGPQGPQGPMPLGAAIVNVPNTFTATQTIATPYNLDLGIRSRITKDGVNLLHTGNSPGALQNIFVGQNAGGDLTVGAFDNTGVGANALDSIGEGSSNTGVGSSRSLMYPALLAIPVLVPVHSCGLEETGIQRSVQGRWVTCAVGALARMNVIWHWVMPRAPPSSMAGATFT